MQIENVLYYLVWAGLFFVMMRYGCGAHVMGYGHHHGNSDGVVAGAAPMLPPKKDNDPVCGMAVATATARTSAYQGRVFYFCSQDCREKFEAAPTTYAKLATPGLNEKEHRHGC